MTSNAFANKQVLKVHFYTHKQLAGLEYLSFLMFLSGRFNSFYSDETPVSFPCQMAIAFRGGVLPDLEATLRALKRWEHERGRGQYVPVSGTVRSR